MVPFANGGRAEPWGGVNSNCLLQDYVALPVTAATWKDRKALEKVRCRDGVEFLEYSVL